MTRALVAILILCLLGVATGAAGLVHAHETDAAHDAEHCVIHATLACPSFIERWVPALVTLGLIVAFLTELPLLPPRQHPNFRTACRGPPVGV